MTSEKSIFKKRLLGSSLWIVFIRVVNSLLTIILSVIISKTLGVHEFGVYAYIITLTSILVIPASLGFPELITRNIASYSTGLKWGLFKGILLKSSKIVIVSSSLIIILSLLVSFLLKNRIADYITIFWIALFFIPIISLNQIRNAILRGLHKTIIGQIPEVLVQPIVLIVVIFFLTLYSGKENVSAIDIVLSRIGSMVVALIFGLYFLKKYIPYDVKSFSPEYDTVAWRQSALTFMIIEGVTQLLNMMDIIMLGVLGDAESVGLYKVSSTGAWCVTFMFTSVNCVLGPIISKLAIEGEMAKLQSIVTYSSRLIFAATLPFAFCLIFYGKDILSMIYGAQFASGYKALAILSFGQLVNASLGSVVLILNMTGNEKSSLKGQGIALLFNVILNIAFIPKWGAEGAAMATCISVIAWNIVLAALVYKHLDIHTTVLGNHVGLLNYKKLCKI